MPVLNFHFLTIFCSLTFISQSMTGVHRLILELGSQTPNPTLSSRANLTNQSSKEIAPLGRRQGSVPLEPKERVALLSRITNSLFRNQKPLISYFRKQQPLALFHLHFVLILRRENQRLCHNYLSF